MNQKFNIVRSEFRVEKPTFSLIVFKEQLDDIDVLRSGEGVTSDTNAE